MKSNHHETKLLAALACALTTATALHAGSVSLSASDSGSPTYATSSFTSKGNWNNAAAPSPANDYLTTTNYSFRTPTDPTNYIFQGNSLTLNGPGSVVAGGGRLISKQTASVTYTITNYYINNLGMMQNAGSGGTSFSIAGGLTLSGGMVLLTVNGSIYIPANLSGTGPIWLGSPSAGSAYPAVLSGSVSNFSGSVFSTNYALPLYFNNNLTQTFSGNLAMAANSGVYVQGTGVLTLSASNSYGGTTTVAGGTLIITGNEISVTNGTSVSSGATLQLQANSSNTFGGTNYCLGNTNAASSFNNGSTVQFLSDSSITFNGGNNLGGLGTATNNLFVNQLTPAGSNNVITFAPAGFNVYFTGINVTGSNGYSLAMGPATGVGTGGTFFLNASNANVTLGGIAGSLGGGTTIRGSSNTTLTSPITAITSLTKQGSGELFLYGASTYSGATLIQGGAVALEAGASLQSTNITVGAGDVLDVSALGATGLTLNTSQVLGGSGSVIGTVDTYSGGIIVPGGTLSAGTLTLSNLILSPGGSLVFDLAHNTTVGSGTNDLVVVSGNLNLAGSTTLALNFLNGSPATGVYTLFKYGSLSGSLAQFSLPVNARYSLTLSNDTVNKAIELIVSGVPASLTWVGDGSGNNWDNSGSYANWLNGGHSDFFYDGDNVLFNDSGSASPSINLTTVLSPGSLTVNATESYDFAGGGSISGAGGLVKSGSGSLILETANNYLGTTVINGGSVQVGNGGTSGSIGSGYVTNSGSLIFDRADNISIPNDIHGPGSVAISGYGSVSLTSTNIDYSGPTLVNSGILLMANAATLGLTNGGTTVASGAQLYITANVNVGVEPLTLTGAGDGNGALRKGGSGASLYAGPVSLTTDTTIGVDASSTLTLSNSAGVSGPAMLTKVGNGTLVLASSNSYTGGTSLSAGIITVGNSYALGTNVVTTTGVSGHFILADGVNVSNSITANYVSPGTATGFIMVNDNTNGTVTTFSGPVVFNTAALSGGNFIGPVSSGYLNVSGSVNTFATVIIRAGNVRFSGTNSSYPEIDVRSGTTSLGLSNSIPTNAVMDIAGNNTAFFDLNGFSQGLAGLKDTVNPANLAWVTNSSSTAARLTLDLGAGNSYTFGGNITGNLSLALNTGQETLTTNSSASSGKDTYTGNTVINGGTLSIGGGVSWTNTPVIFIAEGATLDVSAAGLTLAPGQKIRGGGAINGSLTNTGTIAPGTSTNLDTLTFYSGLTLQSPGVVSVRVNKTLGTSDVISVSGGATVYGGTLSVSNQSGTLVLGDQFTVFNASSPTGAFTSVTGTAGPGLGYSFDPSSGIVTVVTGVAQNPTNISFTLSGGSLSLQWPSDHLGWVLQAQTNGLSTGLSTNWYDIAGSSGVNSTNFTINPASPAVFYRLRKP